MAGSGNGRLSILMNDENTPISHSLKLTTSKFGDIATDLTKREIFIAKKAQKLEKIKQLELERGKSIDTYLKQLSENSTVFKEESIDFLKQYSEKEDQIANNIQKITLKIDKRIQQLKSFQQEKIENENELNTLKSQISEREEELKQVEEDNIRAEQVLYEMTTKPFNEIEMKNELQQIQKTEKTAVDALLRLNYKLIHDLRQQISEERQKITIQKEEFYKVLKDYPVKILNKDELYELKAKVKALKRREMRIDREMKEIANKHPEINKHISELKLAIHKINLQKDNIDSKNLNFMTDYNPDLYISLSEQINKVRNTSHYVQKKLKKSKEKLSELNTITDMMHRKLRALTEMEIDMEHDSLQIASQINQSHQIELDWTQMIQDEKTKESEMIAEISELQRRIASGTGEFDDLIEHHNRFETIMKNELDMQNIMKSQSDKDSPVNSKTKYVNQRKINTLKAENEKIRDESLKLLASIRNISESKKFMRKEIKILQAKLHQEKFYLNKLQLEQKKQIEINQASPRTSEAIQNIKDEILQRRERIKAVRGRIDDKQDVLNRISKVNNISGNNSIFVIEDTERVIDRQNQRNTIIATSKDRENKYQSILNQFCDFYQKIREEKRKWANIDSSNFLDQKTLFNEWVEIMQNVCRNFRIFGI